jgi:hypothetical protein
MRALLRGMQEPLAAVRQYLRAFNGGHRAAMAAAFADPGVILDGMASHYPVALGEPLHDNITGTVALRTLAEGWRIAAWAWAKGNQSKFDV